MTGVRWGIIGPGAIAGNFASGLAECDTGTLVAIASRDAGRRDRFGDDHGVAPGRRFDTYEALIADPDVDAVYIGTTHPYHAGPAIRAMRGGKAVLCEKPAGLIAGEVVAMTEVAAQEGVFFMEALMYRCHPQIARMIDIIRSGEIGEVTHISARFGFAASYDPAHRLFAPDQAGGGILDVGGYPVSLARLVAGAARGAPFADPARVRGVGTLAPSGVDAVAYGLLEFDPDITAEIACAVTRTMDNTATITGTGGHIHLPDPWIPGRNGGPSDARIEVTAGGVCRTEVLRHPEHLFAFEADAASRAIAAGQAEAAFPAMSWADSRGNARVLDAWRHEVGYTLAAEAPTAPRVLPGVLPPRRPAMPMTGLPGVGPVSQLVIGCDNRDTVAEGAIVWDAWAEAGGNAFDTGFIYGGGRHETVLGHWLRARGLSDSAVVIVKGAHTPYCTPGAIAPQLDQSLARLQLDRAPMYILHRDNADVPVAEFVDALNDLHKAGRIGEFGGSNWTVARISEANAYAERHGLKPFSVLNNNLSLATMERPVWPGCVSSHTRETLDFLKAGSVAHLSWSSQARGYFLPANLRDRLPPDTAPDTCFGSAANAERRRRAETLAARRGVTAHNIATAWVLAQPFASFALIGPRSPGEIASTLPGLSVGLTAAETAWLNLETDDAP